MQTFCNGNHVSRHPNTRTRHDAKSSWFVRRWWCSKQSVSGKMDDRRRGGTSSRRAADHSSQSAAGGWVGRSTAMMAALHAGCARVSPFRRSLGHNGSLHLGQWASSVAIFRVGNDGLPRVRLSTRIHLVAFVATSLTLTTCTAAELKGSSKKDKI